jgi:hypothetical protein
MWLAGLRAKFEGKGPLFGKSEFDQLLGHCQVRTVAYDISVSHKRKPALTKDHHRP